MKKKGYYYAIDVTLAIIIIIVGFLLVLANMSYEPEKMYTQQLSRDALNVLRDVNLADVCSFAPCNCAYSNLTALCFSGDMRNKKITLLEYLGELYYRDMRPEAAGIIGEIFIDNKVMPENYKFVMLISNPKNATDVAQLYPLVP